MIDLIDIRQQLHRIPELGFEEHETHALVMRHLQSYSVLKLHTFGYPGALAAYRNGDGPFTLFRADMDALPIVERTGVDWASNHEGRMHACGHDVHTTILLGLVDHVCEHKLPGNFLFFFQPAEEGRGGARRVLEDHHLDGYDIARCYALHVSGKHPVGVAASKSGVFFGIPQEFVVEFHGLSAHAAFPHLGANALDAGLMFYQSMKLAMTQRFNPTDPVIFHVGKMEAGRVMNAVPDLCRIEGTTRCLTTANRDAINGLIERKAQAAAQAFGVTAQVKLLETFDPVVNDATLLDDFRNRLPQDVTFEDAPTVMTGEDFGFLTTRWPGLLFWLGAGTASGDLHTSTFLPDPACIDVGLRILIALAQGR